MTKLHDVNSLQLANRGDASAMRPYIGKDGKFYINSFRGGVKTKENLQKIPVANATLRYDEWKHMDTAVLDVARTRLVGFEDLRRNGLVYTLGNAMGTTVLTWEKMGDALEAVVSMNPLKKGNNDAVTFDLASIPLPVVHADYIIGERQLQASRNLGNGLDITNAQIAARKVRETLENMLFGASSTLTYGGGTIHSYLSFPDKTGVSFASAGEYWDAASKTPAAIVKDVLEMKQASLDDYHYGPWMLYVSSNYETKLDEDYSTSGASAKTIRERIKDIEGIQDVKVVDKLADDKVLLVEMSSETVDLIDGLPFQNVQWSSEGGFLHNFKVMTIQVPRIKSDANGRSGVVLLS